MLKCFNFCDKVLKIKNIQGILVKKFSGRSIHSINEKIKNCPGRDNKFYIFSSNNNCDNASTYDLNAFYLTGLYSRFYKLKGKTVINPKFESIEKNEQNKNYDFDFVSYYSTSFKEFNQNLYKIFEQNKLLIEKDKHIFLNIKNSNLFSLNEIESDNQNIALKSAWPIQILKQHSEFLQKESKVAIKFSIVNEINKNQNICLDLDIPVDKPQFLFGVTFLSFLNDPNNEVIKSLGIEKLLEDPLNRNKTSFLLPTKIYSINPINEEKIPIVIINPLHCHNSNFNSLNRACVPGHDHIDYQLAKDNSLPIKFVVKPISEMGESVLKKDESHPGLILKSMDQIKQEIIKKKLNEGPKLVKDMEGFLVNCKEFDFLYLDEAYELIVNNLIRKGRAQRNDQYKIENWLIAKKNENNEIIYEESFNNASQYLRIINLDGDVFKKWLPVDIFISDLKDQKINIKNMFYSRIIHKILLNLYKEYLPKKNDNTIEDEVYISKEHELEKDILFPAPYVNVININDENKVIIEQIKFLIENTDKKLEQLHEYILQLISSKDFKFDIEKLRDEKFVVNQNNNLVVNIYKEFTKIIELIETHKIDNLKESLDRFSRIFEEIFSNANKEIFSSNKIFLTYVYMNYLLIAYLFSPKKSSLLYGEFYNKVGKDTQILKLNIQDYSIEKLYSTCKYFIEMLKNSIRLEIFVNNQSKGKVIVDRIALEYKEELLKFIEEVLHIKLDPLEIEEYTLQDEKLVITLK
jgi:hypothetical protein